MKFQGDISSIPIADVAQNLAANRKCGTLTIRRGEEVRRIVFHEGKIISYADNRGFSVPGWLAEKGLVDPRTLEKCVQKARRNKKKDLGGFLQEARAMDAEEYGKFLRTHVEEMLYETFTYREGTFEFQENEYLPEALDPEVTGAGLELVVGSVLIEAARRFDDWEAIRKSLPSESDFYRVPPAEREGRLRELEKDAAAKAAVKLLDGTRTIGQVIAALPTSRFDACRAIADLVTRKAARPVDGSELLEHLVLRTRKDKERALVQLKAAQEREPGNRSLLQKVAALSLDLDRKDESAVHHKLLAQGLLEDGDAEGAEKALRQSIRLNPKDTGAWQKLYDLLAEKGSESAALAFGCEMAARFRKVGMNEMARDHLARMVTKFPARLDLRLEQAEVLFALGDKENAVGGLVEVARDLLKKGRIDEVEKIAKKVLDLDRDHKWAKEVHEKIRSGKLQRQRARRRLIIRATAACLVLSGLSFFAGYDLAARREFTLATRQVFAEGLIEKGEYQKALDRLEEVQRKHRLSLLCFFEGREIPEAIREAEFLRAAEARRKAEALRKEEEALRAAGTPKGEPPPPANSKAVPGSPIPEEKAGKKAGKQ